MKILLAEDTRSVAAVLQAKLASEGYQVILATTGQQAVEKYQQETPDLVLMDIDMPGMNGFEATHRIRAYDATRKWAWTPILFLTATATPENMVMAIEAGGDDFVAKALPDAALYAKMKAMSRIAALRTRLAIANQLLEDQANKDGLTGILNRRAMDQRANLCWDEAIAAKKSFGLLMIDIDNFKKFNDKYGHLAGDECLKKVAHTINTITNQTSLRKGNDSPFCARYGGEEFAVIVSSGTRQELEALAITLGKGIAALEIQHESNESWGRVTLSIGGSWVPCVTAPMAPLFHDADSALYKAKNAGRNRYEFSEKTPAVGLKIVSAA